MTFFSIGARMSVFLDPNILDFLSQEVIDKVNVLETDDNLGVSLFFSFVFV